MKKPSVHMNSGTELSPGILHSLGLNREGKLEETLKPEISPEELKALERIAELLEKLRYEQE